MIKKLLMIVIVVLLTLSFTRCSFGGVDLNDTSHDDDYIVVNLYYEVDLNNGNFIKHIYLPTIEDELHFYDDETEIGNLEAYTLTNEITYELYGNYSIVSKTPIQVYAVSDKTWMNIPETAWYETPRDKRLNDDVQTIYGTLPVLSSNYELGDVIRVIYQSNNIMQHFMVVRSDTRLFIRYGDVRKLIA